MPKPKRILLASHGTDGAVAAERLAREYCGPGVTLHHLIVVPDLWKGMMGDDWLNNASTRRVFGEYLESELTREVRQHIARVEKAANRRHARYRAEIVIGKPDECLLKAVQRERPGLVIAGAPRPRGKTGLRSRMLTEEVLRRLRVPILIAPWPAK